MVVLGSLSHVVAAVLVIKIFACVHSNYMVKKNYQNCIHFFLVGINSQIIIYLRLPLFSHFDRSKIYIVISLYAVLSSHVLKIALYCYIIIISVTSLLYICALCIMIRNRNNNNIPPHTYVTIKNK